MGGNEHAGIMVLVVTQKTGRTMNLDRARDYLSDGAREEDGCCAINTEQAQDDDDAQFEGEVGSYE